MENKFHLQAVPKKNLDKSLDEATTLIDMLKAVGDIKQELFDMLESVELLEEDIKQTLYAQQKNRKK